MCCVVFLVLLCIVSPSKSSGVLAVFTFLSTVLKSKRLQLVPVIGVICEETWFGFSVCNVLQIIDIKTEETRPQN